MIYYNTFVCAHVHDEDNVTYGKSYDVYFNAVNYFYTDDLGLRYLFFVLTGNVSLNGSKFIPLDGWREQKLNEIGIW